MNYPILTYWQKAIIKNISLAKWYFHWRFSLNDNSSPLYDELPWITYGAIDWLSRHLTREMSIFEWGSGGSTIFWAKHVKQVVTVEHDPLWYKEVKRLTVEKGYNNVHLSLVEPVQSEGNENLYTSTVAKYHNYSFWQYVKEIDNYPNEYFDIVFVDGRARIGCMKHAINKIKNNGYLILDNSERIEYQAGWNLVNNWKDIKIYGPGPYNRYPWETRIWSKSTL